MSDEIKREEEEFTLQSEIKEEMQKAIEWYKRCILTYESPKFNPNSEKDMKIVNEIKKNWRNYICN